MNNIKKNIKNNLLQTLAGFRFLHFSIFQFFNFLIILFLIFNSSFLISQNSLDQLEYSYNSNTNQLNYIKDAIGSSISTIDLDNQGSANYTYDANGRLISDAAEGILKIEWTFAGKVKQVSIDDVEPRDGIADHTVQFQYDAMGNRVKKIDTNAGVVVTTYYICNAMGKLISIYVNEGSGIKRTETILTNGSDYAPLTATLSTNDFERNVGLKKQVLNDHLGSVRVVVSDVKEPISGAPTFTNNLSNANDYYSYGMQMPGRGISIESHRWGYQGYEKDNELKGEANSYTTDYRLYDPRVGRWNSTDPLGHQFSAESPYSAMGNNPVLYIDKDGRKYTSDSTMDANGNVTYTQTVTVAVLNRSSQFKGKGEYNYKTQQMEYSMQGYVQDLENELEAIYTGSETSDNGQTISWKMDATVRLITDISQLNTSDMEHLIILQEPDATDQVGGRALSDLIVMLPADAQFTLNTGTTGSVLEGHELGHTFGLAHNDIAKSWDPIKHGVQWWTYGSQGDIRNTVMDYDFVEKEVLVAWQVEWMYYYYMNGQLNESYTNWGGGTDDPSKFFNEKELSILDEKAK